MHQSARDTDSRQRSSHCRTAPCAHFLSERESPNLRLDSSQNHAQKTVRVQRLPAVQRQPKPLQRHQPSCAGCARLRVHVVRRAMTMVVEEGEEDVVTWHCDASDDRAASRGCEANVGTYQQLQRRRGRLKQLVPVSHVNTGAHRVQHCTHLFQLTHDGMCCSRYALMHASTWTKRPNFTAIVTHITIIVTHIMIITGNTARADAPPPTLHLLHRLLQEQHATARPARRHVNIIE